jgi:hypothetical protein
VNRRGFLLAVAGAAAQALLPKLVELDAGAQVIGVDLGSAEDTTVFTLIEQVETDEFYYCFVHESVIADIQRLAGVTALMFADREIGSINSVRFIQSLAEKKIDRADRYSVRPPYRALLRNKWER